MSMIQVLNSKERNEAFLKFLLFFVITAALLITAVFFNFRLPLKENRKMQERLTIQGEREMKQQLFVQHMGKAMLWLDSLEKNPLNKDRIEMELTSNVTSMSSLQLKDGSIFASFNDAVVKNMLELKQQKLQMIKMVDKVNSVTDLERDLRNCRADLEQRTRDLDLMQRR